MNTHDPTFIGWLTTGAYAATATLCACAARFAPSTDARMSRGCWLALAVVLALLGVNSQLDVQTALTDRLRDWALRDEWYTRRGTWQMLAVLCGMFASAAGLVVGWVLVRGRSRLARLGFTGVVLVTVSILLRFTDIERADDRLGLTLPPDWSIRLLTWVGLSLISAAAWLGARGSGRVCRT